MRFLPVIFVVSFVSRRWDCRTAANGHRRKRGAEVAALTPPKESFPAHRRPGHATFGVAGDPLTAREPRPFGVRADLSVLPAGRGFATCTGRAASPGPQTTPRKTVPTGQRLQPRPDSGTVHRGHLRGGLGLVARIPSAPGGSGGERLGPEALRTE
jgi:hypothetical protein